MTVTETADPVGLTLTSPELMTPAFVIDDAKLSANIARAKGRAVALGVTYRPHLKTHKSIGIARRQMMTPEGPGNRLNACGSPLLCLSRRQRHSLCGGYCPAEAFRSQSDPRLGV